MSEAGLLVRADRAVHDVTGADAVSYLHRMLTQDVAGLREGHAAYACVLTPRGRIVSDLLVWHLGDRLALDFPAAGAVAAIPYLERYVIADDVVFTDRSKATARFVLVGDGAPAAIAGVAVAVPESDTFVVASLAGAEVRLLRHDLGRRHAFEGMTALVDADRVLAALRALPGVSPMDEAGYEVVRVEEGVPAFGHELDEQVIPNEAGLEAALSFTKGCYPGQEPVVMAKHRGHPANVLVRLMIEGMVEGDAPPTPGAPLLDGGRAVGRITSAVRRLSSPGIRALGYVRHALARPGAVFDVAGGRASVL